MESFITTTSSYLFYVSQLLLLLLVFTLLHYSFMTGVFRRRAITFNEQEHSVNYHHVHPKLKQVVDDALRQRRRGSRDSSKKHDDDATAAAAGSASNSAPVAPVAAVLADDAAASAADSRLCVLVFGWGGATVRQLRHLHAAYAAAYPHATRLSYTAPMAQMLFASHADSPLQHAVDELFRACQAFIEAVEGDEGEGEGEGKGDGENGVKQRKKPRARFVFHMHSNTGTMVFVHLLLLARQHPSASTFVSRIDTIIFDSAPGLKRRFNTVPKQQPPPQQQSASSSSSSFTPPVAVEYFRPSVWQLLQFSVVFQAPLIPLITGKGILFHPFWTPMTIYFVFCHSVYHRFVLRSAAGTAIIGNMIDTLKTPSYLPAAVDGTCRYLFLYSDGDRLVSREWVETYVTYVRDTLVNGDSTRVTTHNFGATAHVNHFRLKPEEYMTIVKQHIPIPAAATTTKKSSSPSPSPSPSS